jgi:hypothetical protein
MARQKDSNPEINADQHRIALTLAYLKVTCPGIDLRSRTKLASSILSLVDGEAPRSPQKKIADAQVVEMVWRQSQCVLNQTGRCPLLVFGRQLAEEINEFFTEEE